jgi:hypothetical protein
MDGPPAAQSNPEFQLQQSEGQAGLTNNVELSFTFSVSDFHATWNMTYFIYMVQSNAITMLTNCSSLEISACRVTHFHLCALCLLPLRN